MYVSQAYYYKPSEKAKGKYVYVTGQRG